LRCVGRRRELLGILWINSISSAARRVGSDVALIFLDPIAVAAPTSAREDDEPDDNSRFDIMGRGGPSGEGRCDRWARSVKFVDGVGSEAVASGSW
jgi:hypothetical protein